eukprot:6208502-Amphidinium_carterae.1
MSAMGASLDKGLWCVNTGLLMKGFVFTIKLTMQRRSILFTEGPLARRGLRTSILCTKEPLEQGNILLSAPTHAGLGTYR